jgi:L-iditol 2-dehydrogenase
LHAVLLRPGGISLTELPTPEAPPGGLTVALRACGICGTDLEKIRGNYSATGRIGHEPAGVVRSVADGLGAFRPGDRVFVHHHVPCLSCAVCRAGAPTFCPDFQRTNIDPGGFSEVFSVSSTHVARGAVLPLPPEVSDEEATFIEPMGCCLEALATVGPVSGRRVLLLGLGPIGQIYLRLLRAFGASWVGAADISAYRRDRAGGADGADDLLDPRDPERMERTVLERTAGVGPDLVVVATGAPAAITEATRVVRRGGTVNLFGLPERGRPFETDPQELYLRGVRLVPTYATTEVGTNRALELLAAKRVRVADLVTHRFPLEEAERAFAQAALPQGTLKVVMTSGA